MFEGKNINQNMNLRNQLKNENKKNSRTIQSYFTRVSQIKEQLEAVEENFEEGEIVITTLNGLPISWESFIQGICARRKLISFSRLWEECAQEESRLVTREEYMGETDDQSLTVYTKKNFKKKENKERFSHNKKKDKKPKKTKRDILNVRCYTCDENGNLEGDCPI